MNHESNSGAERPETLLKMCDEVAKHIQELAERLADLATAFDHFGPGESHAEGSAGRFAADLRDHADLRLSHATRHLQAVMKVRAETSYSEDLMMESIMMEKGDGSSCLKLIEKYYERTGDPTEGQGTVIPSTLPDAFFWETVRRVEAIPSLALRYPEHLRFAARHFQGLPMMVSHHIDVTPEFERLAELLRLGAEHPLDVAPRRKRGGMTPAMSYLEPLIWRMNSLREVMVDDTGEPTKPFSSKMISNVWALSYTDKTPERQVEVLLKLASLPRLTKSSALEWSREVVVPYILVSEGENPATSEEAFIRNVWNHRAVKSIPTFRSRLERAVTDFLKRYSRDRYPDVAL